MLRKQVCVYTYTHTHISVYENERGKQPIVSSAGENSIIKHTEKLHSKLNVSCAVMPRYFRPLWPGKCFHAKAWWDRTGRGTLKESLYFELEQNICLSRRGGLSHGFMSNHGLRAEELLINWHTTSIMQDKKVAKDLLHNIVPTADNIVWYT